MKNLIKLGGQLLRFLILGLLLVQPNLARAEDFVFFTQNYQPVRGSVLRAPESNELAISSASGPNKLKLDEIRAVFSIEEAADFIKLLQSSNFKEKSREGRFRYYSLSQNKAFWESMRALLQTKKDDYMILNFRVDRTGKVVSPHMLQSTQPLMMQDVILTTVGGLKFQSLPADYSGDWVPSSLILNPEVVEKSLFLIDLKAALEPKIVPLLSKTGNCAYRIQALYSPSGSMVYHKILSSKAQNAVVLDCLMSDNHPLVKLLKREKHDNSKEPLSDQAYAISYWIKKDESGQYRLSLNYDFDFLTEGVRNVISDFIESGLNPNFNKSYQRLKKQDKTKFNMKHSRFARFLITIGNSTWPHIKEVSLTTSSGDPGFDRLCQKSLETLELVKLPTLLQEKDYKSHFTCELMGRN